MKLGNFSQNSSTAKFRKFSKFSKFSKNYDWPKRCEVIILGEIVFLSQIFKRIKSKILLEFELN